MTASTTSSYPYTQRELDRAAGELEHILAYALWALSHRDLIKAAEARR